MKTAYKNPFVKIVELDDSDLIATSYGGEEEGGGNQGDSESGISLHFNYGQFDNGFGD